MPDAKVVVELEGIPETLLWTLYQRAVEARRPDGVIRDPAAIELVSRIDYPFEERFGARFGQWQGLRARCFDDAVRRFLGVRPSGTVVALGEGLETQFWRVDNGRVRWLSIDVPEAIGLRERFLPESGRQQAIACSALDERWLDEVDASEGVLLTAQGLLMYFGRDEAYGLLAACAERFSCGTLVFDAVPEWLSARSRRGELGRPGGYEPPPWLWGADSEEEQRLATIPNVAGVRVLRPRRGRGLVHGCVLPLFARVAPLRHRMLSVFELSLG